MNEPPTSISYGVSYIMSFRMVNALNGLKLQVRIPLVRFSPHILILIHLPHPLVFDVKNARRVKK